MKGNRDTKALTPAQGVELATEGGELQAGYFSLQDPFAELKFADILPLGL